MEYLEESRWTTLSKRLDASPKRSLSPTQVAGLLADVARAQRIAHKISYPLGPLMRDHIYLDANNNIKIVPFSVEAQLARGANVQQGQLLNWDMLSFISPDPYYGGSLSSEQLDLREQYYLGLLGLELLRGQRVIIIQSFCDISEKLQPFFRCPRSYFDMSEDTTEAWTEDFSSSRLRAGKNSLRAFRREIYSYRYRGG